MGEIKTRRGYHEAILCLSCRFVTICFVTNNSTAMLKSHTGISRRCWVETQGERETGEERDAFKVCNQSLSPSLPLWLASYPLFFNQPPRVNLWPVWECSVTHPSTHAGAALWRQRHRTAFPLINVGRWRMDVRCRVRTVAAAARTPGDGCCVCRGL